MSDADTQPQPAEESSRLRALEARLDQLETLVHEKDERIAELEAEKDQRIAELEAENETLRERLDDVESSVDFTQESLWDLEDFVLGEYDLAFVDDEPDVLSRFESLTGRLDAVEDAASQVDEHANELEDVRDEIRGEQRTRSQADSNIRARMTLVEDAMDGEINESRLVENDKLARIIRNGVQDVESSPTASQERAEDILLRMADWGTRRTDSNGDRVVLYAKDVRDHMRDRYDKSTIQSSQVQRAFTALTEFAKDSPRQVLKRKNEGNVQLLVFKPDSLLDAAEGVSR